MAISIDPQTFVISIPKADLTPIQVSPTEIRELNLNAFRLELKAYEDNQDGMYLLKTHTHNTEVSLGGLTYARTIQILEPYTITFEDGQYAVNLVGANSNVGDRINVNQVSIRSQNSAGLISSPEIQYASYQNAVWVDVNATHAYASGTTVFPAGNRAYPVNNVEDAVTIANLKGFSTLQILSDMDIDSGTVLTGFKLIGKSHVDTLITILDSAQCANISIENCNIGGILDGGTIINDCMVGDLEYFNGHIHHCGLYGTIELDGSADAVIENCYTVDQDNPPDVDMGGSGQSLAMPNYSGLITIGNLSSSSEEIGIGINHGMVTLDSDISAGTIIISGVGVCTDNTTGTTSVNTDGLLNKENIFLASAIHHGTAQGAGTGTNQIQLATTASSTNGAYDPSIITIRSGTGEGQTRQVYQYNGSTRIATVDRDWKVQPDNTSVYVVLPHPGREHVNEGLAQAGSTNTITLNASASDVNDSYVGQLVFIRSGTGADQVGYVSTYNGTLKVATVAENWGTIPDTTSAYVMLPTHSHTITEIAGGVWDIPISEHTDIGSTGEALSDAGSAGNPWSTLVSGNTDTGTFGELVGKKLLTFAKFIGLK